MLSVIIPVFNVELYIRRCIDSVISQTFDDMEIILIDDGSTDNSGKICDEYSSIDSRIITLHQENKGVSQARNKGLDIATGTHILFVDADDWLEPEMISLMMKGNVYDMVVCGYFKTIISNTFEKNDTEIISDLWSEKEQIEFISEQPYIDVLCKTAPLWNKIVRRELIGNTRFIADLAYGEDLVFLVRILHNTKNVKIIKTPLYHYLANRPGNVVSAAIDERTLDYLKSVKIIYDDALEQGEALCGICRIQITLWTVLKTIPNYSDEKYLLYVRECINTLRYPSFINRLRYVFFGGGMNVYSAQRRIAFFLYSLFPTLMIKTKIGRRTS